MTNRTLTAMLQESERAGACTARQHVQIEAVTAAEVVVPEAAAEEAAVGVAGQAGAETVAEVAVQVGAAEGINSVIWAG